MRQKVFNTRELLPLLLSMGFSLSPLTFSLSLFIGGISSATAQSTTPVCQPPKAGEYLLLVVSPTPESQEQVRRALSPNTSTTICKYLNDTVTRIGGFTQIENANAQAQYINNTVGLSAFVAQKPADTPTGNQPTYNPKALGAGYAVLVDYFNRPEIATQVRQLLGNNVGLVSYGQRPYLLAVYTKNQKDAHSTLQKLSDRGFFAMLVDSRKVMRLKETVSS
jgi:hypothetical protein